MQIMLDMFTSGSLNTYIVVYYVSNGFYSGTMPSNKLCNTWWKVLRIAPGCGVTIMIELFEDFLYSLSAVMSNI